MSHYVDNQFNEPSFIQNTAKTVESIKSPQNGVGEEWPLLISKKWLACQYGCYRNGRIIIRTFRAMVLTPEVLTQAGIDTEVAYSNKTRTFNAIQSRMLTQILRGYCLIAFLFIAHFSHAQVPTTSIPTKPKETYLRDTFIRDTFPGQFILSDSIVRMVDAGAGQYRFEKVLSTIVVDGKMIKEYRWLVRASDGGLDPFDLNQHWILSSGGAIDPKRILLFKQNGGK